MIFFKQQLAKHSGLMYLVLLTLFAPNANAQNEFASYGIKTEWTKSYPHPGFEAAMSITEVKGKGFVISALRDTDLLLFLSLIHI